METSQTQDQTAPTKEQVLSFLKESLEIAELRAQLQEANTKIAINRAEELKALMFISQVTNPKPEESEPHVVTEEDMKNNPELETMGVKVGDTVGIPTEQKRKLKKDGNS